MKHLNKIIFINSASMRYEELELDGNIHLSGYSGAGKTSVERAILYFFTADQRNLGIDLNSQKTFIQYYFASADSHIVYEVKKDDGAFCVILTNYENRIQYAFVDSPYRKEWIVDPVTRMVASSWSEITKNIPQHIDRDLVINIKDYNEILWGCHRDHKYARYMLAKSKGYDNLLKSLKNVFLHSGFSHDGLKTNIVCSLPDNNPSINLVQLRSRLQDYLNISEDLRLWYKVSPKGENKTQQQAREIIDLNYSYLEKISDTLAYFKSREDAVLWWRPHPLLAATLHSIHEELALEYERIVSAYQKEGWGIYDDTGEMYRAIAWSDALYGDNSSVAVLYGMTGKPVLVQNYNVSNTQRGGKYEG